MCKPIVRLIIKNLRRLKVLPEPARDLGASGIDSVKVHYDEDSTKVVVYMEGYFTKKRTLAFENIK